MARHAVLRVQRLTPLDDRFVVAAIAGIPGTATRQQHATGGDADDEGSNRKR